MDVEVFVHGVPHGEDFWGNEDRERLFLGKFYTGEKDAFKLVIQTRKLENKLYTYYSYIVGKDVLDVEGRPGSYFGLTIRLDCYYKDFKCIFYILDLVFQRNILGVILNKKGDGFQYKVSKFADAKISDIESCIFNLIETCFDNKKASPLSNVVGSKTSVSLNIYDASQLSVQEAIQKGAIVSLSPYFESVSEKNILKTCAEQVKNRQKAFDSQLANANSQLERMKNENMDKEQAKKQLQNEISSLEKDKSILAMKVANLNSILNQIRQLLSSVGGLATPPQGRPKPTQPDGKKLDKTTKEEGTENEDPNKPTRGGGGIKRVLHLFKNIQPFLVILILIIVVTLVGRMPDNQKEAQIPNGKDTCATDTSAKTNSLDFKVFEIDGSTKENLSGPLDIVTKNDQKWYAAKVETSSTGTDNVKWTIEGVTKIGDTRNDTTITFQVGTTPKDSLVRISYVKDGSGSYKELTVKK